MNRPDWRDPQMPVLAKVKLADGSIVMQEIDPEILHRYAKDHMRRQSLNAPDWRDDPTYNLRRKLK